MRHLYVNSHIGISKEISRVLLRTMKKSIISVTIQIFSRATRRNLFNLFKRKYSHRIKTFYDKGALERIFNIMKDPDTGLIPMPKFLHELKLLGLTEDDPRLAPMKNAIESYKKGEETKKENEFYKGLSLENFIKLTEANEELIVKAFEQKLVIPDWSEFQKQITDIFDICKDNAHGEVATYIPQLAKANPSHWALSVCTVDGQRFSLGNYREYFTIQSVSKPFTYALALDRLGKDVVHRYVGKEPSGRMFNELILNYQNIPHNPMINPGAIVICSLIHSMVDSFGGKPSLVFDNTKHYFDKLAGGAHVGFNNSVYISEQEAADRNYAIAFYLKEHKCFPPMSKLGDTLKYYFRCCSLNVTTSILAALGATLANSGVNPLTFEKILHTESVKNTLSLMYSCGMYDYSGEFAFEVGLPAKSGVSGALVVAIPNMMGIGMWSPRLDKLGNSIRGIQFCQALVKKFPFHQYDDQKVFPNHSDKNKLLIESDRKSFYTFDIISAAAEGRLDKLKRSFVYGIDLEMADYDGRTALHLASTAGHLDCVKFLIENAGVKIDPKDRWGKTPLETAEKENQTNIVEFLKTRGSQKASTPPQKSDIMKNNEKNEWKDKSRDEKEFNPIERDKDLSQKSDIKKNIERNDGKDKSKDEEDFNPIGLDKDPNDKDK